MVGGTHGLDTRLIVTIYNQWPVHMCTTLWYTTQALVGMDTSWVHCLPQEISVAKQHGMEFLCTQLNSLVDVLKVYIRTAVSVL